MRHVWNAVLMLLLILTFIMPCSCLFGQQESYPIPEEALPNDSVPAGKVEGPFEFRSTIYPGTLRKYHIYVPAQYDPEKPACSLVVQDGKNKAEQWRLPQICDNLIHRGEIPVVIGIFVEPGIVESSVPDSQPRFNRSFEYDSLGDRYARFLLEELLPEVGQKYRLSSDPSDRAIAGSSSGAICAFNVAWERPDAFRRVISAVGTYVGLRGADELADQVRKHERKPIRVFLQDGSHDLNIYAGDWWVANQGMLSALRWAGYEVEHEWGTGGHNGKHSAAIMPKMLRYIWENYPEKVEVAEHATSRRVDVLEPAEGWQELSSGHEAIESLACNGKGQVFFCDSGVGRIYRVGEDLKVRVMSDKAEQVNEIEFSPDGDLLACRSGSLIRIEKDKTVELLRGQIRCFSTLEHSILYYDEAQNHIGSLSYAGEVGKKFPAVGKLNALTPTADRAFVHLVGSSQHTWHVARTDLGLQYPQQFGYLEMPYLSAESGASGSALDSAGRLYVATSVGIQILDQLGRVNFIISSPSRQPITDICFGGQDGNYLFVTTADGVYRRKLRAQGIQSYAAPTKPPRPRL